VVGNRITRPQTIDGIVTPAFIHNGDYFLENLQVYADGLVDCWELLDLALFREQLASGWVVTQIPEGEQVHVHGLGDWVLADARWELDADALFERVTALVRELNPRMENLHDCHGRTTEVIGGMNASILGSPPEQPVRFVKRNPWSTERVAGGRTSVLVRSGDLLYLADLRAFADGMIELGRLPEPEQLDLPGLTAAVASGRVCSSVPAGARVAIHGLGSFTAVEETWSVDIADILRQVPDLIDAANGRPDSVKRCRAAHAAYVEDPTHARREALRVAYEAVPSHNRRYVGDMDTKDIEVRMILYGEQEIEGWSHRAIARAEGLPLPTITLPTPKPE
jgi:hypothetical protein